jgi:Leucine-rich repeat (LRR) protein
LSAVHHLLFNKIRIKSLKRGIFTKFTNVRSIDLSGNELSTIDFNEFANNKKLETLDVHRNQISKIEMIKNSAEINIIHLMIHDNALTDLSELCKLKKVVMVDVSRNRRLDYNKVTFSCWSELTHLYLADTNLKHLNHNYRVLTGCNQLEYLDLSDNDLEILCFENFPAMLTLTELNIGNNSLINLDVEELKRKCQVLSSILIAGNKWNCTYYLGTLKTKLEKSGITGTFNKADCLEKSGNPEIRSCPKIEPNYINPTTQQNSENTKGSAKQFLLFWIFIVSYCVLSFTKLVLLISFKKKCI